MSTGTSVSARAMVATYAALMALAAASFALSYAHLGPLAGVVALAIAAAKAALVVLFFMELVAHGASSRVVLLTALALVVLLAGLLVADVLTRSTPPLRAPVQPSSTG